MANKKNYYYVLVFSDEGAIYVTRTISETNYAVWDKDEKPLAFSRQYARDICTGLLWSGFTAVVAETPYELDGHPYDYEHWDCKFVRRA